jgi:hypothetical protein
MPSISDWPGSKPERQYGHGVTLTSAAGRSRMTEVEHRVLVPALEGVRASLVRVTPATAPSGWDAPLDAALVALRRAVPGLRPWCRGSRR